MTTFPIVQISANILQITSNITIPKWSPSSDFPKDVLKYMKANATPKQTLKLMKLNKYFIPKKCPFIYFGNFATLDQNFICQNPYTPKEKDHEIEELPKNLAISGTFFIDHEILLPQLISKIVICNLKCLILSSLVWKIEKISYNDFKVLTSSGGLKILGLGQTIITSKEGKHVPYSTLLDHVPLLRNISLDYNRHFQFSKKFVKKVCVSNLEKLLVYRLPENMKKKAFIKNIAKKNANLDVKLYFEIKQPAISP